MYEENKITSRLSYFLEILNGKTGLFAVKTWVFQQGMLFQDKNCWWGELKQRIVLHEGVDFYSFQRSDGGRGALEQGVLIPVLIRGRIVTQWVDFLGKTVWLKSPDVSKQGKILYTGYSHIVPEMHLQEGKDIFPGQSVGVIAPVKNVFVPPHLHLSVFYGPKDLDLGKMKWSLIHKCREIDFIDPLGLLL